MQQSTPDSTTDLVTSEFPKQLDSVFISSQPLASDPLHFRLQIIPI